MSKLDSLKRITAGLKKGLSVLKDVTVDSDAGFYYKHKIKDATRIIPKIAKELTSLDSIPHSDFSFGGFESPVANKAATAVGIALHGLPAKRYFNEELMYKATKTIAKYLPKKEIKGITIGSRPEKFYHASANRLPRKKEEWVVHAGTKKAALDRSTTMPGEISKAGRVFELELKPGTRLAGTFDQPLGDTEANSSVIHDILTRKGYHGVLYRNKVEDSGSVSVAILPKQLKPTKTLKLDEFKQQAKELAPSKKPKKEGPSYYQIIRHSDNQYSAEDATNIIAKGVYQDSINTVRKYAPRIPGIIAAGAAANAVYKELKED
jgi:hypothetical protein